MADVMRLRTTHRTGESAAPGTWNENGPTLTLIPLRRQGRRVLRVEGEIDIATRARFQQAVTGILADQPGGSVVLDFSGLVFLDASGVHALIQSFHEAHAQGTSLWITAARPAVARVLHVTNLHTSIPLLNTVEAALGHE